MINIILVWVSSRGSVSKKIINTIYRDKSVIILLPQEKNSSTGVTVSIERSEMQLGFILEEIKTNKANDLLYSTKAKIRLSLDQISSNVKTFRWI